jgi:hypothetical protein
VNPVTVSDLVRDRMAGLHSSSFLFRREALLGPVGLVDEELPASYGEDYDMLLRTAKVAPIEVVNEPLVEVTWQGQSYYYGRWATYAQALEYLLDKHPEFDTSRRGRGRIESQIAFALAASAQSAESRRWAWKALRHDPSRVRAYLAVAISFRLISAAFIAKTANRFGKGI